MLAGDSKKEEENLLRITGKKTYDKLLLSYLGASFWIF